MRHPTCIPFRGKQIRVIFLPFATAAIT